jgi:hypothetical protein
LLADPHYNSEHKDWDPCESCLTVINDLLAGFKDQPAAEEDELGAPDPIWEEFYPTVYDPTNDNMP